MLEPLAHDGPWQTYDATLREQHADGMVISGPRVDDDALLGLVRDGFPIVLQGSLPDVAVRRLLDSLDVRMPRQLVTEVGDEVEHDLLRIGQLDLAGDAHG